MAVQGVFSLFTEPHLIEMITANPFPHFLTVPGHLNDGVVQKKRIGNFGIC